MHLGSNARPWVAAALALAAMVGGGCVSSSVPEPVVEESTGELGHGVFRWTCVHESDGTCGTGVFPSAVALGARFDLQFTPDDDLPTEIVSFTIESVSPRRILHDGEDFVVRESGEVALLATGDGFGVDYVVLHAYPLDRLELQRVGDDDESFGPSRPLAQVGVRTEVRAIPFHDNERLAGALDFEWDNLTPELVEMQSAAGNEVTLIGLREGTARLAIRVGEHAEILELTVEEAPPEPEPLPTTGDEDGSGSDTDGSGTDGSGTDGSGSGDTGATGTGGETEGDTELGSSGGETEGGSSTGGGR